MDRLTLRRLPNSLPRELRRIALTLELNKVTGQAVRLGEQAAQRKRDLDTISRYGGDEFCIIFTDCGDRKQLAAIAEKLLLQFSRPFHLTDATVEVTTSIGISMFPDNGSVMKELEIASDRAMYAAKRAGKNTYRFSPFNADR